MRPGRRRLALLAVLAALVASPLTAQEVGKPVPSFEIATLDGQAFKSSDVRGQVVIVNFWATWCTFCREEMP